MPRKLIVPIDKIRKAAIDAHGPSQDAFWYDIAEAVPDPTTELMAQYAKKCQNHIPHICYDRHFPEGARLLGLNGAEIVFNPSATVAGLSHYLWKLEQPAHAVANGYFMVCSNRVGTEAPWNIGRFYGSSYFVDPRGNVIAMGSEDKDELVVAEVDFDMTEDLRRMWPFHRDRRLETFGSMAEQLP